MDRRPAKDADRPRKHIRVVKLRTVDIEAIAGAALPVKRVDVNLGGDRKGIVFTVSSRSVEAGDRDWLQRTAQTLGNLVHPHPATIIILPPGETLDAYEVVEARD